MKKYLILFIVLFLFPVSAYAGKWVYVKDGKIVRWRTSDSDLKDTKLAAHGYIPVEEEVITTYDPLTQSAEKGYRIEENKVVGYYTVKDRDIADAKSIKVEVMKRSFISEITEMLNSTLTTDDITPLLTKLKTVLNDIAKAETIKELQEISYD